MTAAPAHRSQVTGSPWPGIHAAQLWSGRHYGRQIRNRPQFTEWMTTLGRQAELEMAVHA